MIYLKVSGRHKTFRHLQHIK